MDFRLKRFRDRVLETLSDCDFNYSSLWLFTNQRCSNIFFLSWLELTKNITQQVCVALFFAWTIELNVEPEKVFLDVLPHGQSLKTEWYKNWARKGTFSFWPSILRTWSLLSAPVIVKSSVIAEFGFRVRPLFGTEQLFDTPLDPKLARAKSSKFEPSIRPIVFQGLIWTKCRWCPD